MARTAEISDFTGSSALGRCGSPSTSSTMSSRKKRTSSVLEAMSADVMVISVSDFALRT